jgi:CRISPR-associated protein (TIGR02710 family)
MSTVSCKALIMVVSRTDAIEIAVQELKPEAVGLILSQDILGPVVMKCEELGPRAKFRYRLVDSPMEIGNSFERFEHLLSEIQGFGYAPEDVILDVTGGTTPMRFGAALAAMTRGMRMVHQRVPQRFVDGDWILDPSRQREIFPMDNPLESTGLLREGQAVELFNRRDYGAAALVFEDVARKVSGVERRHYYDGLLLLSEGYAAWDVADYATALQKLCAAREELNIGYAEAAFAERAATLDDHIKANLSFLGKAKGKKLSIENVVDMLENARRRIADQGRYDDGVARLYRAVEMWHQWRLLEHHSISTKGVRWEMVS